VDTNRRIAQALASNDEEVRLQGLKELATGSVEDSLDLVFQAFGDSSWRVRKEAIDLFLRLPLSRELVGEIVELLHAEENAGLRNAAVEILTRMGRDAVPMLLDQIRCPDHDVRKFIVDILGDIADPQAIPALLKTLHDEDSNVRAAAAENLGKLKAEAAVADLLAAMRYPDVLFRFTILDALSRIGVPVSLDKLLPYREEKLLRKALVDCLGKVGDQTAATELVAALDDEMRNVRDAAVLALAALADRYPVEVKSALAGTASATADSLLDCLSEERPVALRSAAARILGWFGSIEAILPLLDLLQVEALQPYALSALIDIASQHPQAMIRDWAKVSGQRRAYLAYILGEAQCAGAVDLLRQGLSEDDRQIRQMSAHALGKLGSPEVLPDLTACLRQGDGGILEAVTQALISLGNQFAEATLSALKPLLAETEATCRMAAVTVLGRLAAPAATALLGMALKDPAAAVRRAAIKAFDGRPVDEHLNSILLALADEDAEVRRATVEVLGGSGVTEAGEALQLALRDEDFWVRSAAVRALGRLGGEGAVAEIAGMLKDPVGLVSIAALETLAALSPDQACAHLIEALDNHDEEVVSAALNLLSRCDSGDWLAAHADRLINHPFWAVRNHFVRYAVETMGLEARPLLEARLKLEPEDLVKQQILDLLEDITPR